MNGSGPAFENTSVPGGYHYTPTPGIVQNSRYQDDYDEHKIMKPDMYMGKPMVSVPLKPSQPSSLAHQRTP